MDEDDLELYGKYKAKISLEAIQKVKNNKDGKLVLVTAINPTPAGEAFTFSRITAGSSPAFIAICLTGSCRALVTILPPNFSSCGRLSTNFSTSGKMFINAVPPPATMPSSTAALVADKASSTLNYLSFISTSVAAPTPITATPPASFAKRSCNCSFS
mgnify:CR=1 FL=1